MLAVAKPGNTVELKLHKGLGQWRLVAAPGSETTNRSVGAKVSVPTPVVGLSVVGALNTAKKSKVVQRQYFAASTLIAITNVYRARHSPNKPDDHAKWDVFCKRLSGRFRDGMIAA